MSGSSKSLRRCRLLSLALSTVLAAGVASPAFARSPHPNVDPNGVDLTDGSFNLNLPVGSVGKGPYELQLAAISGSGVSVEQYWIDVSKSGTSTYFTVNLGSTWDNFTDGGASTRGTGATLTGGYGSYTYTKADGTVLNFGNPGDIYPTAASNFCDSSNDQLNCTSLALSERDPNGKTTQFDWTISSNCANYFNPDGTIDCIYDRRLAGTSNTAGYAIAFTYATDTVGYSQNPPPDWFKRTGAQLTNASAPGSASPSVTFAYPSAGVTTITTAAGQVWRITTSGGNIVSVREPRQAVDTTISYGANGVSSVTRFGVTTSYNRSVSGSTATMVVTDAQSHQTTIISDMNLYLPTSVTDGAGQTTSYQNCQPGDLNCPAGRVSQITLPSGRSTRYVYDTRGNVVQTIAQASSGGATLSTSAGYEPSCTNVATCNSPQWTRDAANNQSDYAYDATTGQLTSVTSPAVNGVRPQTRLAYTVQAGVSLLTSLSTCRTQSACLGTADETRVAIAYDANLLPSSVTVSAGDGSLNATTGYTYDPAGDVASVDGPLPGSADTTNYTYDADRRLIAVISPDPDGSGPHPRRERIARYVNGSLIDLVQLGTYDPANGSFTPLLQQSIGYDAYGRKVAEYAQTGAGSTYGVTQFGYDSIGLPRCTAVRMNASGWASLPADACTVQAEGSAGPDRVTQTDYDAVGRVSGVTRALGTAAASTETMGYTPNGKVAWVSDGENNRTSYGYDGFDRQTTTAYPVYMPHQNTSNGGDYTQLTYDANGNVISSRLRDGQVIGYSYDALNRKTYEDNPNTNVAEVDVSYTYDLMGRLTQASDQNGWYNAFEYDALGRTTRQYSNVYGNRMQYDPAGQLRRETWDDGFFVTYEHDNIGAVTAIRENGGAVLASYVYDDLGRRTSLTRGNGTVTGYGYDADSQLATMTQDLAGSAYDLTLGFSYNPAGQIATRTSSNDAYAYTGAYNTNRGYTANGLNQYTQSGSVAPTYDGRGNLTQAGGATYQYNTKNQLFGNGSGQLFYHNPIGLLGQTPGLNLDDVGADLATEVSGGVLRRYVYGPGDAAPILWYEGAGTGDKRYLHADERGSVIAVSDGSGNAMAINRYDEYGIPQSGNLGRFQYTGQQWIAELGMYDYKARTYSPTLGRFLQADPIGYADGMNWYAYVGADPVNFVDSSGLAATCSDGAQFTDAQESSFQGEGNVCDAHGGYAPIVVNGGGGGGGGIVGGALGGLGSGSGTASGGFGDAGSNAAAPRQSNQCQGMLRRPSTSMMNEATNDALADTKSGATTSPLTSEFSKLNGSPDFSRGWTPVTSIHGSTSYERAIPGNSGMVVKVYIGDRNFGGSNTVTITSPTYSVDHIVGVLPYELGLPVNARNAAVYLSSKSGC